MARLRSHTGFTLIELMIVVVVIGILATIAIPRFGAASNRAKEKEADGILRQILTMQEAVRANTGAYTADLAALTAVGYEAPTTLRGYGQPTITATCAGMASTGSHNDRKITYATGAIEDGPC